MVIKKETVMQYILLWIAFIFHGSLLTTLYEQQMLIFSLIVILVCLYKYKRTVNKQIFLFIGLLLVNIVFVRFINNGGIGLSIWFKWTVEILSIWCGYSINKNKFFDRIVKIVYAYAAVSLVFTAIYFILPSICRNYLPTHVYTAMFYNMPFKGYLPIHVLSEYGDKLGRNLCIFTEPGLYQIPLNVALYLLLNSKEHISLSKKKYFRYLFVILLAVVTTKSTTAYLGAVLVLSFYVIQSNGSKKLKALSIFVTALIAIIIDWTFNGSSSILGSVVISKITSSNGFNLNVSTGGPRIMMLLSVIEALKHNFWGMGYNGFSAFLKNQRVFESVAGMALFTSFAHYGLQMILFYVNMLANGYKNRKGFFQFVLLLLLYLNTVVAQTEIFYPYLFILFFINMKSPVESRLQFNK